MSRTRALTSIIGLAMLFTATGCARFPSTPPTSGKQLVLTLKVRGRINPIDGADPSIQRHYFIAIDNDNNVNTGPWAAVFPPYGGNGWVTSQDAQHSIGLTSYVQYDSTNTEGYIYGILPGSYFLNVTSPQPPIRAELLEGGATLRVVVDFQPDRDSRDSGRRHQAAQYQLHHHQRPAAYRRFRTRPDMGRTRT